MEDAPRPPVRADIIFSVFIKVGKARCKAIPIRSKKQSVVDCSQQPRQPIMILLPSHRHRNGVSQRRSRWRRESYDAITAKAVITNCSLCNRPISLACKALCVGEGSV